VIWECCTVWKRDWCNIFPSALTHTLILSPTFSHPFSLFPSLPSFLPLSLPSSPYSVEHSRCGVDRARENFPCVIPKGHELPPCLPASRHHQGCISRILQTGNGTFYDIIPSVILSVEVSIEDFFWSHSAVRTTRMSQYPSSVSRVIREIMFNLQSWPQRYFSLFSSSTYILVTGPQQFSFCRAGSYYWLCVVLCCGIVPGCRFLLLIVCCVEAMFLGAVSYFLCLSMSYTLAYIYSYIYFYLVLLLSFPRSFSSS
jgi:hypothetical protein